MHGPQVGARDRLPSPSLRMGRIDSSGTRDARALAEECPVALVYDGSTAAVVMATPANLSELAIGFSLTEAIIRHREEIEELEIVTTEAGVELRMWLHPESGRRARERQRRLVGPTGCGLCGIESLNEAVRSMAQVTRDIVLTPGQIRKAVEILAASRTLNHETRATHAAGLYLPNGSRMVSREDVGRHNALDKLAGALAAEDIYGRSGAVVLTSRISVEMVQKTAAIGAGILVAISAPTALAVRTAAACGITLIGIARGEDFEIFSHPAGVLMD